MKYIKQFTTTKIDTTGNTKDVCGGKGYNLIKMKSDGLEVPNGIVITTEACNHYRSLSDKLKHMFLISLTADVMELMPTITADSKTEMVSVRSGAAVSLPGMMDTILNVGAGYVTPNKKTKFLLNCKERFIDMYLDVVMGVDRNTYKDYLTTKSGELFDLIKAASPEYKDVIHNSIKAVFDSWDNERAIHYRNMNGISHDLGTAVVIQAMVFGNLNAKSGSGVLFTRNPNTGEKGLMGEFLTNAQGEEVVAGTATPMSLDEMPAWNKSVYKQLCSIALDLEQTNKDMQDIEFTIENGKLFILQTRAGKRSATAEVRIALDMRDDGIITDLKQLIKPQTFSKLKEPQLPQNWDGLLYGSGIGSGGFLAHGKICTSVDSVLECKEPALLVAEETTPEDIKGMEAAVGILTTTGGATSHAAVVARSMNKPCVVGAGDININDLWSDYGYALIDGRTGKVFVSNEPFELDTEGSLPMDLIDRLLQNVNTQKWTVEIDSIEELITLQDHIYKVALPVEAFLEYDSSEVVPQLASTFDLVVATEEDMDANISELLGNPLVTEDSSGVLELSEEFNNMVYLKGGSESLPQFRTMADVMDQDYYGVITPDFISRVMGDEGTFNIIDEQVGITGRVINLIDLVSMLEIEYSIGL